jgi:hypothetical protein
MRYAAKSPMDGLVACPFCRQLAPADEAEKCPECGLAFVPLSKLPPSHDVEDEPTPPEHERLPWGFSGRMRGPLVALALLGIGVFFAPWAQERAPELRTISGLGFASLLRWMWAPFAAWLVLIPLVVSRRSIHQMRGARVAVAFLAGIVLVTVLVRLGSPPESTRLRPVAVEWAWGLWATGLLATLGVVMGFRFGGDLPSAPPAKGREVDSPTPRA